MNFENNPWIKNEQKEAEAKKLLKKKPLEWQVQASICKYVRETYPEILFFFVHNGHLSSPRAISKAKSMGFLPGVSDLVFLQKNKEFGALLVEIKRNEGDKPNKRQVEFSEKAIERGYQWKCVGSLTEFKQVFYDYIKYID